MYVAILRPDYPKEEGDREASFKLFNENGYVIAPHLPYYFKGSWISLEELNPGKYWALYLSKAGAHVYLYNLREKNAIFNDEKTLTIKTTLNFSFKDKNCAKIEACLREKSEYPKQLIDYIAAAMLKAQEKK